MDGTKEGGPSSEELRHGDASAAISALGRLLGPSLSIDHFWSDVWEKAPHLCHCDSSNRGAVAASLLTWNDLLGVLQKAQGPHQSADVSLLVMDDGCPTTAYDSCHAAYLDGCSIIVNHLDKIYEPVHAFCQELRQHLPHVFVNMYLTPPESQAVAPHADDRDVIVLQVAGCKRWKVYPDPPVPLPYPSEQAGKSSAHPVPQRVLDAQPLVDCALREGDALYMPRGFVHEACTGEAAASLHLTFALATHDWSWSSVASAALLAAGKLSGECAEYRARLESLHHAPRGSWWWRRSIPPALICGGSSDLARKAAQDLATLAASDVSAEAGADVSLEDLTAMFAAKVAHHNARQDLVLPLAETSSLSPGCYVRRFTDDEKTLMEGRPQQQQGLVVREQIAQVLLRTLSSITTKPVRISDFEDGHLICIFSKVCFAAVCINAGLLCTCTESGERVAIDLQTPAQKSLDNITAGEASAGKSRVKKRKRKHQALKKDREVGMAQI